MKIRPEPVSGSLAVLDSGRCLVESPSFPTTGFAFKTSCKACCTFICKVIGRIKCASRCMIRCAIRSVSSYPWSTCASGAKLSVFLTMNPSICTAALKTEINARLTRGHSLYVSRSCCLALLGEKEMEDKHRSKNETRSCWFVADRKQEHRHLCSLHVHLE